MLSGQPKRTVAVAARPHGVYVIDIHLLGRARVSFHFEDAIAIESAFHMIESCLCMPFAPTARIRPPRPTLLARDKGYVSIVKYICMRNT